MHFLKIIECSRIMLANHVFWQLMLFYTHLLQPSLLWLFIGTFLNDANPLPNWILRDFDVSWIRPQLGRLTYLEIFTWQNLTPAERVTLADWDTSLGGSPHVSCKHDQIKLNDYMDLVDYPTEAGYLTYHFHVNRPLVKNFSWFFSHFIVVGFVRVDQ